jgi:hypothetical protein
MNNANGSSQWYVNGKNGSHGQVATGVQNGHDPLNGHNGSANGASQQFINARKEGKVEMVVIIMKSQATMRETSAVIERVEKLGFQVHLSEGNERTIIGLIGDSRILDKEAVERMPGVDRAVPVHTPSRAWEKKA